jgi:hypothetical protein
MLDFGDHPDWKWMVKVRGWAQTAAAGFPEDGPKTDELVESSEICVYVLEAGHCGFISNTGHLPLEELTGFSEESHLVWEGRMR